MSMLYELKNNGTSIGIKGLNRSVGELRQAFLERPRVQGPGDPDADCGPGQAGYLNSAVSFPCRLF